MPVKVKMVKDWDSKIADSIKAGLLELVTDIHTRSAARAPVLTTALRNSGRVEPITNGYAVRYGSSRVPYARRRHFENKKNPNTLGYLAIAGENVVRGDITKYFTRKVKV